jgi:hypothetical protein
MVPAGTAPYDFERQYCGGSLITPSEVLTAAHCVDFVGVPGGIPLSDLRVVVGRTVLASTQGQKRRAAAVDIHPRWDPVTPGAVRRPDQPGHLPGRQRRPAVLQGRRRLHPGRHHQLGHRLRRDRVPQGLHPPQQPGVGNSILLVTGAYR